MILPTKSSEGDIQNNDKLWTTHHVFCTLNFLFSVFLVLDYTISSSISNQDMQANVYSTWNNEVGPWNNWIRRNLPKSWNLV